jgi:chemotaxis protein histidine kinase CheA
MNFCLWPHTVFIVAFLGAPQFFYAMDSYSYVQKLAETYSANVLHSLNKALINKQKDIALKHLEQLTTIFKDLDWQTETIERCIAYIKKQVDSSHFEKSGDLLTLLFDALDHPAKLFEPLKDAVLDVMKAHNEQKKFDNFKQELLDIINKYIECSSHSWSESDAKKPEELEELTKKELRKLKTNLATKIDKKLQKKEFEGLPEALLKIFDGPRKEQTLAIFDGFDRELEEYKKKLQRQETKYISLLEKSLISLYHRLNSNSKYARSDAYINELLKTLSLVDTLRKKPERYSDYFEISNPSNKQEWWGYCRSFFTFNNPKHIPTRIASLEEKFSKSVCSTLANQARVDLQNDKDKGKDKGTENNKLWVENFLNNIKLLKNAPRYDSADLTTMCSRRWQSILDTFNLKKHTGQSFTLPVTGLINTLVKNAQGYTKEIPTMIPTFSDKIPSTKPYQESVDGLQQKIAKVFTKKPMVSTAGDIGLYPWAGAISWVGEVLKNNGITASVLKLVAGKHLKPLDEQIKNNVPVGLIFRSLQELIPTYGLTNIVQGVLKYINDHKETIDKDVAALVSRTLETLKSCLESSETGLKSYIKTGEQKFIDVVNPTLENISNVLKNTENELKNFSSQSSISVLSVTDKRNFFNENLFSSSWKDSKRDNWVKEKLKSFREKAEKLKPSAYIRAINNIYCISNTTSLSLANLQKISDKDILNKRSIFLPKPKNSGCALLLSHLERDRQNKQINLNKKRSIFLPKKRNFGLDLLLSRHEEDNHQKKQKKTLFTST